MKKSRKKIMIVTPYFPPNVGGVQNYAYNIAYGLIKKYGWEIIVVTSNIKNKKILVEQTDGIKIYRLPSLFVFSNTPINPLWFFQLKKIINNEKPDLINAHSPVPFIADIAALAAGRIPFVVTYHAGTMKKEKFFFDLLIKAYEKLFLRLLFNRADKIICSSDFVKHTIAKSYISKSITISPAVDTSLFKPGRKISNTSPTVLFIGRYANVYKMKGLYYLIDAMKNMPNVTLKIIGEKIVVGQKNIKCIGVKTGQDLVKEIQNSDLLVLPSLAHMESFGMVLLEAMACKIPVIGTRIGGIPEVIISNKDGLLVPAKDSYALRKAIEKLLNDRRLARKMGENGYRKVKDMFSWEKKTEESYKVFSRYLKN